MARLGDEINVETIICGAENLVDTMRYLPPTELAGDLNLLTDLYAVLGKISAGIIPNPGPVAVFGELCFAPSDNGMYTEPLTDVGAGFVGTPRGIGSVLLEHPVHLADGDSVHVVPALSFNTVEIDELEDGPALGVAQLYPRLAVPLVGQTVCMFRVSRVRFAD